MSTHEHTEKHDADSANAPRSLHDQRQYLKHEVQHYSHMLSEQGPMNITFVHNNTLLGLQARHFEEAVVEAERVLGGRGYQPVAEFRAYHARGRIVDKDIDRSLDERKNFPLQDKLATVGGKEVLTREVYRAHMVSGADAIDPANLQYEIQETDALASLQKDVPQSARDKLLMGAEAELLAGLAKVGTSWMMAHWVQAHLGLDLPRHLRLIVLARVADTGGADDDDVNALFGALHIPAERKAGYLACIDRLFEAEIGRDEALRNKLRVVALREEASLVNTIVNRHFGIEGNFAAINSHFRANIESYAVVGLWQAALAQFGVEDPYSPTDFRMLQPQEPQSDRIEALGGLIRHMERWGGPPIPLTAEVRAAIDGLVSSGLELSKGKPAAANAAALEEAQLRWTLLHDLGERHLNGRGFQALQALVSLRDDPALTAMLERLRAHDPRQRMHVHAQQSINDDFATLAKGRTHSDLIKLLTGEDPVERVNNYMIRICTAFMDEGLAAWRMPGRALGFYDAWRNHAQDDRSFDFDDLAGWRGALDQLPTLPEDAVIQLLNTLGVPQENWGEYLGRMLARLKGWAGMAYWYELHPAHYKQSAQPIDVIQYLAVRLFYESLLVRRACRTIWNQDATIAGLRSYFDAHTDEYLVRRELFAGKLPEMLAGRARDLVAEQNQGSDEVDPWRSLADAVWASRMSNEPVEVAAKYSWRMFRIAQLLGWCGQDVRSLSPSERDAIIAAIDAFPEPKQGPVWLAAFERHYRDEVLNAMAANRGRGRWLKRATRPKSQVIFCIDEREENIHRHYEELDPGHETLGAAGFFGVAIDYCGLDEHAHTPLCPAVATPAHRVFEAPRAEAVNAEFPVHERRKRWTDVFNNAYWETKRNVVASYFLIDLAGFLTALPLIGRVFAPVGYFGVMDAMGKAYAPEVRTRLTVTREAEGAHGGGKPVGFTDVEQADRIEGGLRNWGLVLNIAPIVVICGHGSMSHNNPHENAHDCGACGGKHGSANARAFAAMANRRETRDILRQRGINIADDTWFVGAIHNTASDLITFYDTVDIPKHLHSHWKEVERDLIESSKRSARERCRRFQASPKDSTLDASLHHTMTRSTDFSQVRPEWGHATNAFALVGRRALMQGIFFDRRGFGISYDPTQDADGKILERILLAVGPVGAGINLEYYFSTVDTKVYGSDTKVPHNVTGMIGIMAGAHSDLQTGLPKQMTEVHEAMRLQLIVDAPMAVLGEIYGRQPGIQQLLNGQWVHLVAHDPETGEFNMFVPGVGFVKWDEPLTPLPEVKHSYEWFKGKYNNFLPPARIAEPTAPWTATGGGR